MFPHARSVPVALLVCGAVVLTGCESMGERERGTAVGAGVGAAAGAVLGSATGNNAGSSAVVGAAIGAVAGNLWSKRMEDKRKAMEQATAGTGIDVSRTAQNELKVSVPADAGFSTGSAQIQGSLRPVLDQFAQGLDAKTRIRVIGHTDSTGSDAINNPLSLERAESVRDYLAGRGVAASRVDISGRGSHEPVADNGSADGRARNRRVEIFLREPEQQG